MLPWSIGRDSRGPSALRMAELEDDKVKTRAGSANARVCSPSTRTRLGSYLIKQRYVHTDGFKTNNEGDCPFRKILIFPMTKRMYVSLSNASTFSPIGTCPGEDMTPPIIIACLVSLLQKVSQVSLFSLISGSR